MYVIAPNALRPIPFSSLPTYFPCCQYGCLAVTHAQDSSQACTSPSLRGAEFCPILFSSYLPKLKLDLLEAVQWRKLIDKEECHMRPMKSFHFSMLFWQEISLKNNGFKNPANCQCKQILSSFRTLQDQPQHPTEVLLPLPAKQGGPGSTTFNNLFCCHFSGENVCLKSVRWIWSDL